VRGLQFTVLDVFLAIILAPVAVAAAWLIVTAT
jgi:hypothetical protein